jgi:glutamate N-acetyltransferase/amino-acid N-acetyltransferase
MSITAPSGFVAAGHAAGIKASGDLDMALVATDDGAPVAAAGVFTSNQMTAAPVRVSRAHLEHTGGRAAAVVLTSGNANAATGAAGKADAIAICAAVAQDLGCDPHEVLICQTGLIGIPLPMDVITLGVPELVAQRRGDGGADAAEAIRTTDTHRKEVVVHGDGFTVAGMAKGAAMLEPNMATMLAVLTTDAAVEPAQLEDALRAGVATSFNRLSTDGCQSTNDTVLLLASGRSGTTPDPSAFTEAVAAACTDLARQMAGDAEGATKVVTLTVKGAADDTDADRVARAIANSALCKCSWYGCDPYWGRLASEAGASGAAFDEAKLSVAYGGITVASGGVNAAHDEAAVAAHMAQRHLEITVDLGIGQGSALLLTNDLTHAYVDENMGTS